MLLFHFLLSLVQNEKDSGLEDNDPLINDNLFEGDIMLPKGVSPRAALRRRVILWPNKRRIPYKISEEFDSNARENIHEAIKEFHLHTASNSCQSEKRMAITLTLFRTM